MLLARRPPAHPIRGWRRRLSTGGEGLFYAWATPLLIRQLKEVGQGFNARLTEHAIAASEAYQSCASLSDEDEDELDPNGLFFSWQHRNHHRSAPGDGEQPASPIYEAFAQAKEVGMLRQLVAKQTAGVLSAIGERSVKPYRVAARTFMWASVMRPGEGGHHLRHFHPDSVLSGVYYSSAPADAGGALVLEDPRGPLPPFASRVPVDATTGTLAVWPSWLVHQVTPTTAPRRREAAEAPPRVAWSFNVYLDEHEEAHGVAAWDVTSSVMVGAD